MYSTRSDAKYLYVRNHGRLWRRAARPAVFSRKCTLCRPSPRTSRARVSFTPTVCFEAHVELKPCTDRLLLYAGVWKAASHCSEIRLHPNGRFLYVGNRGHESLAVYKVDQTTGGLELVEIHATQGKLGRRAMLVYRVAHVSRL